MDRLPPELLHSILNHSVCGSRFNKNELFPLRLVCKSFDALLRPYLFRTIQLDFSRFARGGEAPRLGALESVGPLCKAVYCDVMVVRDEGAYIGTYNAPGAGIWNLRLSEWQPAL